MIILRKLNKLFGIRDEQGNDPLPNPLFLPDPDIERQYGEIELQVENTKKYDLGQNKLDKTSKTIVKELRKEIIKGRDTITMTEIMKRPIHTIYLNYLRIQEKVI